MKTKTYVSIPQPCHEKWEAMTPQAKGRFCGSCAKMVVDFSAMSDTQVLHYLTQSTGRLCGRFAPDQLERPLQPVMPEKKKIWWMAALMPVMLFITKAGAQEKFIKQKAVVLKEAPATMGLVSRPGLKQQADTVFAGNKICGTVKDEKGNPIPFAAISAENLHTQTDEQGNFFIEMINVTPDIKLLVSHINYEQEEIIVNMRDSINIILKEKQAALPEVCVSTSESYLSGRLGGAVSVITITKTDTAAHIIRKIFHAEAFKVYPNPAKRGTDIKIDVRQEGSYSLQLLDAGSKLIHTAIFDAVKGAAVTAFHIPSSAAAGIYFIRLINDDTRKQYTEKMVVE